MMKKCEKDWYEWKLNEKLTCSYEGAGLPTFFIIFLIKKQPWKSSQSKILREENCIMLSINGPNFFIQNGIFYTFFNRIVLVIRLLIWIGYWTYVFYWEIEGKWTLGRKIRKRETFT